MSVSEKKSAGEIYVETESTGKQHATITGADAQCSPVAHSNDL
jgi:hypothetical protein